MSTANCRPTGATPSSAWLSEHPEHAALVAAWRAQAEAIRARYGAVAERAGAGSVSISTQLMRSERRKLAARWAASRRRPSIVASWSAAAPAGWRAARRRRRRPAATCSPPTRSRRTGSTSSRCAIRSRCRAASAHHMTQWLSKRLGYELRIPDLQSIGLKLVGGRLLPGPTGAAAAFYMYEGAVRRALHASTAPRRPSPETALRFREGETRSPRSTGSTTRSAMW